MENTKQTNNTTTTSTVTAYSPYGKKRTGEAVRNAILENKKTLENNGKKFPFKRIVAVGTIIDWMDKFEWEKHRLEQYYEQSITIDDEVNEFNMIQLQRKKQRTHNLNDTLDNLEKIMMKLSLKLSTIQPTIQGNINKEFTDLSQTLSTINYIYTNLESSHEKGTLHINTIKDCIKTWRDIKERLSPHHNPYTTKEEYLEAEFEAIDYYFDKYATE